MQSDQIKTSDYGCATLVYMHKTAEHNRSGRLCTYKVYSYTIAW